MNAQDHPDDIFCECCGVCANCSDPIWQAAFNLTLDGTYCKNCIERALTALGVWDMPLDDDLAARIENWLENNRPKPM